MENFTNFAFYDDLSELVIDFEPEVWNAADEDMRCWMEHVNDYETENRMVVVNHEYLYIVDKINGNVLVDAETVGTIRQFIEKAIEYYKDEVLE